MFRRILPGLLMGAAILSSAHAQPVTYQGRLSGSPAPTIDIQATLYSTSGGSTAIGSSSISDDVVVSGNLFTTTFDFGSVNYNQPLFLELVIRDGTSTVPFFSLVPLSPRVELTPVPLAYAAVNDAVDDADADDTNELNTNLDLTSTTLSLTDAGGTLMVDLAPIIPPPSSGGSPDNILIAADGSPSPAVFVDNDGLTGFGTTFPQQEIDVRVVDGTEAAASFIAEVQVPNTTQSENAGMGANVGFGQVAWTNPNGVSSSASTPASVNLTNGSLSQIIRVTDFNLSVPASATITGVALSYRRNLTDPNPLTSSVDGMIVRLFTGASQAPTLRFDLTDGTLVRNWGNSSDLWGLASGSLTPAMVNNPNFGFDFQVVNSPGENVNATLEDVSVIIYYNPNQTTERPYTAGVADGAGDFVLSQSNDLSNPLITVESNGRVGLNNSSPGAPLRVGTNTSNGNGAFVTNGGTWTSASSREWKSNFQSVDSFDVLNKLSKIPIMTWEYDNSEEGIHLGPDAEDFHEAFGLGQSEQYISTVDADGVALIAIQALEKENNELQKKNEELEARITKLEELLLNQ